MKPAQWTAVLILALMVGGISFVSVYLGGSSLDNTVAPTTQTLGSLSFPFKVFPRDDEKPRSTEIRRRGHQDFWFVNDSGQDVKVGLNEKGCTCSEVELMVAPDDWMPHLVRSAVTIALAQPPRRLADLALLAAACQRDQQFPELPSNESGTMLTKENSAPVPAGALGRVRLSWRQEAVKQLNTYADLWMGERSSSLSARLEAHVFIAQPLDVDKEVMIPAVTESTLNSMPKGQQADIYCWSLTRPSLSIKARLLHGNLKPESDPVEVGEPVPLTEADLRRLQSRESLQLLTVRSGYRIPVTVHARAKDGTPIEWGYFSRGIQLSSPGGFDPIDPVEVRVTGAVLGDITVGGGGKGAGQINLGPFSKKSGVRGKRPNNTIVLQSDEENVELELDQARVPKYLKPTLSEPQKSATGHRSWVLCVEVKPGEAQGEFPRSDPDYRDSAIYVKTKIGNPPTAARALRIPVLGVANDG